MIACLTLAGFVSCEPQDSDDHSLGNTLASESDISFTITPTADNPNEVTFTNTSTYKGGVFLWVFSDGSTSSDISVTKFYKKAGNYSAALQIYTNAGSVEKSQSFTIAEDYVEPTPEHTWVAVDSEDNLGKGFNSKGEMNFWWADGSWSQTADPGFSYADGVYTITTVENGGSEWMAQNSIQNVATDIKKGEPYDIHATINASKPIGRFTLKVCDQGDDDNTLIYRGDLSLEQGENSVDLIGVVSGGEFTNAKFFVDLGGVEAGVKVEISNIIIQVSSAPSPDDDPTQIDWAAADSERNLAAAFNTKGEMSFWWADSSWSQTADPGFSYANGVYAITTVENGGSEWMAQSSIHAPLDIQEGETYDISFKIVASKALSRYTFKLCEETNDDNTLLYINNLELEAGENIVQLPNKKKTNGSFSDAKLFFDLGGAPAGIDLQISDIVVQKHKLK